MTIKRRKKTTAIPTHLIAPCGMNCRLCVGYIREKNTCLGCRAISRQASKKSEYRSRCTIKNCEQITAGKIKYCSDACGKKYTVVVRSFVDGDTNKRMKISNIIEDELIDIIIEKFRMRDNFIVLDRKRQKTIEKELMEYSDEKTAWDHQMLKKLGHEAGFIITGSYTKMSKKLKIQYQTSPFQLKYQGTLRRA